MHDAARTLVDPTTDALPKLRRQASASQPVPLLLRKAPGKRTSRVRPIIIAVVLGLMLLSTIIVALLLRR